MNRRFIVYFFLIAVLSSSCIIAGELTGVFHRVESVPLPTRQYTKTVVLLPLDSRPPCTQFVEQLGNLANIRVVLPPTEYLDNYTQPGNRDVLAIWLKYAAKQADAVIISTDMLLSGGLLASRSNIPSSENISAIAELLTDLRHDNPDIRLYSFHIIPRLLIADHSPYRDYQYAMQRYSILKDQVLLFENPLDYNRLVELKAIIPKHIIDEHRLLYERNVEANLAWMALAKANILDSVIIGQDDGYHFGLPNIVKQRLENEIARQQLADKVIINRGADEVALTLLGRLANEDKPPVRVFVEYSTPDAHHTVMPYMSQSVATTVTEKIRIVHAIEVETPEQADFILFVHVGRQNHSAIHWKKPTLRLKQLIESGRPVALVDLAENFYKQQTLLPSAIEAEVRIDKLVAYAGWNTTSNAVGTAITQASLYLGYQDTDPTHLLRLHHDNLTFLTARLLDDWYYLKDVQPQLDKWLYKSGINPYHLQSRKSITENMIRKEMAQRTSRLLQHTFNKPLYLPGFSQPFLIMQIENSIHLPWDRTFEIKIDPKLSIVEIQP